jgi:hypothetical protein
MNNTDKAIKDLIADPVIQQRLAKHLVLKCFRNSALEELHAGKVPDSKCGDYSDVVVRTPYGEIPWNELSRFSDAEIKVLITDVVNRTYHYIHELFDDEKGGELIVKLAVKDSVPEWDEPR